MPAAAEAALSERHPVDAAPRIHTVADDRQAGVAVRRRAAVSGPVLEGGQHTGALQPRHRGDDVGRVQGWVGPEAAVTDHPRARGHHVSDRREVLVDSQRPQLTAQLVVTARQGRGAGVRQRPLRRPRSHPARDPLDPAALLVGGDQQRDAAVRPRRLLQAGGEGRDLGAVGHVAGREVRTRRVQDVVVDEDDTAEVPPTDDSGTGRHAVQSHVGRPLGRARVGRAGAVDVGHEQLAHHLGVGEVAGVPFRLGVGTGRTGRGGGTSRGLATGPRRPARSGRRARHPVRRWLVSRRSPLTARTETHHHHPTHECESTRETQHADGLPGCGSARSIRQRPPTKTITYVNLQLLQT